jgi:hypothetical protein
MKAKSRRLVAKAAATWTGFWAKNPSYTQQIPFVHGVRCGSIDHWCQQQLPARNPALRESRIAFEKVMAEDKEHANNSMYVLPTGTTLQQVGYNPAALGAVYNDAGHAVYKVGWMYANGRKVPDTFAAAAKGPVQPERARAVAGQPHLCRGAVGSWQTPQPR